MVVDIRAWSFLERAFVSIHSFCLDTYDMLFCVCAVRCLALCRPRLITHYIGFWWLFLLRVLFAEGIQMMTSLI